ncbi:glycosyltransferase [Subtercola boreus]|uniref:glycosyltransferase n=1 Tax=Subtercola boreus TaxID=120213 RepID=UPI001559BCEA|nr:glycosyltransferase [Subtercola boreus]
MAEQGTDPRRALLVVEPRFAVEHVGVRRVIADYWQRLLTRGYTVDLGVVSAGHLHRVSGPAADETLAAITTRHGEKTARTGVLDLAEALELRIDTAGYDVSMLTNPWLCDQLMPHLRFTHGVVYDLVPNLLAAQALDFGTPNWVAAGFAHSHHRGFQFFLDSVETILCISQSTRSDFLRYYTPDDVASVVVDIPFDVDRYLAEQGETSPDAGAPPAAPDDRTDVTRVLLVNVLDPRKNIAQVSKALAEVSARMPLVIDIVGSNRLPPELSPKQFLKQLASGGATVTWHENAPDDLLTALYQSSDVLLFPSLYEGLGLPILEAQSFGTPCISSSGSSLGEVNLNPALYVDPRDPGDIARVLAAFIAGESRVTRGESLADLTRTFLAANRGFDPR